MDREAWQATLHGIVRVRHDLATKSPPYITHVWLSIYIYIYINYNYFMS